MKLQRQLSMGKLSSAVRDLLRPLSMAKCRELWEGLTVGAHRPADDDDYFRGSYEFSCTTTPVNVLTMKGRRPRRQRRLPPCIGAKQATEMLAGTIITRRDGGWSPEPERSPQAMAALDVDGLAEEFIQRFREQLRMQVEVEQEAWPKSRLARSVSTM